MVFATYLVIGGETGELRLRARIAVRCRILDTCELVLLCVHQSRVFQAAGFRERHPKETVDSRMQRLTLEFGIVELNGRRSHDFSDDILHDIAKSIDETC